MKEYILLARAFARVYLRMILLWLTFYIPTLISLAHQKSVMNSPVRTAWDTRSLYASSYGMLAIILVGVVALGRAFHINRQHTWMRRLPVSQISYDIFPLTLLFLVSFVTFAIPWRTWLSANFGQGPQTVIYLVALPLAVFFLCQRIRNTSAAILCASLLVGCFQFANNATELYTLLSAHRNGFMVEAITACALSLVTFAFVTCQGKGSHCANEKGATS